jgi:hypothetical protein
MVYQSNITSAVNDSIDPLIIAINNYRQGLTAYNTAVQMAEDADEEDALHEALIAGPDFILTNWTTAATSREAAGAAILLAEREESEFAWSPVADAMRAAANAYLKADVEAPLPPASDATRTTPLPTVTLKDQSPNTLFAPTETANYLRVSIATLARWRCEGSGPAYLKRRGRIFYKASSLLAYIEGNERRGTRPTD